MIKEIRIDGDDLTIFIKICEILKTKLKESGEWDLLEVIAKRFNSDLDAEEFKKASTRYQGVSLVEMIAVTQFLETVLKKANKK